MMLMPKLRPYLGPFLAFSLVLLACLGSLLFVSDGNALLKEKNHWRELGVQAGKYGDVESAVAKGKIPDGLRARARELAAIYRQNEKPLKAASVYRLLWLVPDGSKISVADGLELASLYGDMGDFSGSLDCYKYILKQDMDDLSARDPALVRDYNNIAQCCYMAGCATADPANRKNWFKTAIANANIAGELCHYAAYENEERRKEAREVIEQNLKLSRQEII
jgi:tetratricopeptide (TPR) repeat protein